MLLIASGQERFTFIQPLPKLLKEDLIFFLMVVIIC